MDEMLIAAVIPIMSMYRLPHGQYGYSGHVINLPQDVLSFAATLPRLPSQVDIVVVRKDSGNQSHRDFHVRRSVMPCALQWLITNDRYYRANQIRINPDILQLLEDSDVINALAHTVDHTPFFLQGLAPQCLHFD